MIRAVIVDDELHCVESLENQLDTYCKEVEVVGKTTDPKEGNDLIGQLNPDLLFLDIEMPGMSGFDLLKQMDKTDFEVIFTTAYDEYAVEAFRVSALDYLLKPIRSDHLIAAVQRVSEKQEQSFTKEKLDTLFDHLHDPSANTQKIAFGTVEGLEFIEVNQITHCEAMRNYTKLALADGSNVIVSKTLKEVEEALQPFTFLRVHKSYLINTEHIIRYVRGQGGYAIVTGGTAVTIARNRRQAVLDAFRKL